MLVVMCVGTNDTEMVMIVRGHVTCDVNGELCSAQESCSMFL